MVVRSLRGQFGKEEKGNRPSLVRRTRWLILWREEETEEGAAPESAPMRSGRVQERRRRT